MFPLMSIFFAVVLAAICGNAAPLIQERAIGADLLSTFKIMGQYASAAYCASNYGSPGDQLTCASAGMLTAHDNKPIVVSFRGSTTIDYWLKNLDLDTRTTDICPCCTAHHGFWNSWVDVRDHVLPAVKQASTTYPTYQIAVTGHSLGGAIATLAAAQLRNSGYNTALYSFGSPRIGGANISSYITNQAGGNYRITHWNDPVPKLPLVIMGFVHVSPEYYINKPNKQDVHMGDIKTYEGAINLRGNSAWIAVDIEAHRWYFSSVYTCDAKKHKRGLQIRGVQESVDILATF